MLQEVTFSAAERALVLELINEQPAADPTKVKLVKSTRKQLELHGVSLAVSEAVKEKAALGIAKPGLTWEEMLDLGDEEAYKIEKANLAWLFDLVVAQFQRGWVRNDKGEFDKTQPVNSALQEVIASVYEKLQRISQGR